MAKVFQVKKTEPTDRGYRVVGVVGRNEDGDDLAHADYYGSGGLKHHPEEDEMTTMVSLDSGRFNVTLGNKTTKIELKKGETALFSIKDGIIQGSIVLEETGNIKMNKGTYSATLFEPLKDFLDGLVYSFNNHIHTVPLNPSPAPPTPTSSPVTQTSSPSYSFKSEKVKLK